MVSRAKEMTRYSYFIKKHHGFLIKYEYEYNISALAQRELDQLKSHPHPGSFQHAYMFDNFSRCDF